MLSKASLQVTKSSPPPSSVNRLDNGTIEITFVIPWSNVQSAHAKEVDLAIEQVELPGFRKGKAPRDLVLPKLDQNTLHQKALEQLVPKAYSQSLNEHQLKPILHTHIKVTQGKLGEDWQLVASTCETPKVSLPADYQTEIKKIKPEDKNKKLTERVDYLRRSASLKIPHLLIEEEANHRLGHLAENLSQLGLDIPRYLQSKKTTVENLRAQTASQAKIDLEIEFILEHVRASEKLPDREKTLDFLVRLV